MDLYGMPGQAPRLIHRLREPVIIDQSAFSRMNEIQVPPPAILPGGYPVRSVEDVARGLGLSLASEQALIDSVREWVAAPDPISFRRSVIMGMRSMAPADLGMRSEIARRCAELWRASATSPSRPKRWTRLQQVTVQKSLVKSETDAAGLHILSFPVADAYRAARRAMRVKMRATPPELIWMVDSADDLDDPEHGQDEMGKGAFPSREAFVEALRERGISDPSPEVLEKINSMFGAWVEKGAGHKYIKRIPSGKPSPRWKYFYRLPEHGRVTSSEDLVEGAKFKVAHAGKEGHFEVIGHDKAKGLVHVRHDESGRTAHVQEKDLHRMVESYHRAKTATAQKEQAKKEGKAPPAELPRVTMADLARGEYDNIEGFGEPEALTAQAAAMAGKGREFAIMKQPGGFALVGRRKRTPGSQKEVKGEEYPVKLRAATGKGVDTVRAEFVLLDVRDLIPSHNPDSLGSFSINSAYPEHVQERRYHAIQSDRNGVYAIAKDIDPAILVNTNPDAVNGPPIITQDRVVLGGNKRTMAVQVAYREFPESARKLREYLIANARKYGVSSADVRAMEQPMIVRRMTVKDPGPDNSKLRLLGRRMNEALTHGLDPRSEEVAVSQFVTSDVTEALVASIEPDQTLSDFLYSPASADFVTSLRRAGIIDNLNQAQYVEDGGKGKLLNEDGRRRVERVMAARLIPDADLLERMNPTLRESLALATPSLVMAEQKGWPVAAPLKLAIAADLHIRATSDKPAKVALEEFLSQTEVTSTGVDLSKRVNEDPVALALLHVVREHVGTTKTPAGFRGFALRATQDFEDHAFGEGKAGAVGMLAGMVGERMTPAEALDIEFGITPERSKEKKTREAAARDVARREKEAEKERKRPRLSAAEAFGSGGRPNTSQPGVGARELFAASDRSFPTLIKAVGPNRLLSRAIHLARWLVDCDLSRATTNGRRPTVREDRVVEQVMTDARVTARNDPSMSAGLPAVTENTVRGLVRAMVRMISADVNKGVDEADLFKAMQRRPPGAGWLPIQHPRGGARGWYKMAGGKRAYWYPDQGFAEQQATISGEKPMAPEVSKLQAEEESEAVEDLNEVHRANVIVSRVLASFGEAAPPRMLVETDYRPELDRLKSKIARSRSLEEISHLQEQARAVGKRAGDAARDWELRQQRLFDAPPAEPAARELTDEQVREHAKAVARLGITSEASKYLSHIVERHGKHEARKVHEQMREDAERRAPPPRPVPRRSSEGSSGAAGGQMALFGLEGQPRGTQGSLFRSMRLVIGAR